MSARRDCAVEPTDRAAWTQPAPTRPSFTRASQYVAVSDGTRLATDLYLPEPRHDDERFPTVLVLTPYCRAIDVDPDEPVLAAFAFDSGGWGPSLSAHGLAVLVVEARGAAASFGRREPSLRRDVPRDDTDVVDWVIAQEWSNGRVGATGISAPGMAALWLVTAHHPAVGAVAPLWTAFDMYAATHPGGTTINAFVSEIGDGMRMIDENRLEGLVPEEAAHLRPAVRGLRRVDEDTDGTMLAAAVAEHRANWYIDRDIVAVTHRDDPLPGADGAVTLDDLSPATFLADIVAADVPVYAYGGWLDGAFGADLVDLHSSVPGSRLLMGPWGHGGRFHDSPCTPPAQPSDFDHAAELAAFFLTHLGGGPVVDAAPVRYFTMGAERWRRADTWPPASEVATVHLAGNGGLCWAPPAEAGVDRHDVDFGGGTGARSRYVRSTVPVDYGDLCPQQDRLLTYTTAALAEDVEVTGHPLARLYVSADADDFLAIAYLEDVDPSGAVRMVTEGVLRARFRATAPPPPGLVVAGPYRSFRRADAEAAPAGEVLELEIPMFPVSWLFRSGHAIRVAVAGADADSFPRTPAEGDVTLHVHRGSPHPSQLALPIAAQDSG